MVHMGDEMTTTPTNKQLTLLDTPPDWRIDEHMREIGRRGVESARAALREALAARRAERDTGHRSAA